jgi:hypothetical protein
VTADNETQIALLFKLVENMFVESEILGTNLSNWLIGVWRQLTVEGSDTLYIREYHSL